MIVYLLYHTNKDVLRLREQYKMKHSQLCIFKNKFLKLKTETLLTFLTLKHLILKRLIKFLTKVKTQNLYFT